MSHLSAEAQAYELSLTTFPGALAGSWIKTGAVRIQIILHIGCQCHRQSSHLLSHNIGPMIRSSQCNKNEDVDGYLIKAA